VNGSCGDDLFIADDLFCITRRAAASGRTAPPRHPQEVDPGPEPTDLVAARRPARGVAAAGEELDIFARSATNEGCTLVKDATVDQTGQGIMQCGRHGVTGNSIDPAERSGLRAVGLSNTACSRPASPSSRRFWHRH
jgi:hypothetical protein